MDKVFFKLSKISRTSKKSKQSRLNGVISTRLWDNAFLIVFTSFPSAPRGFGGRIPPKDKNILQAEQYINSIASRQGSIYALNTKVLIIAY